jgi:hypothetical protein
MIALLLECQLIVARLMPYCTQLQLCQQIPEAAAAAAATLNLRRQVMHLIPDAAAEQQHPLHVYTPQAVSPTRMHCYAVPVQVSSPQPNPSDGLLYLSNSRLKIGMDPKRGGAITYLSSPVMPPEWAGRNLVNTWDSGRLIQQSYYGAWWGHWPVCTDTCGALML